MFFLRRFLTALNQRKVYLPLILVPSLLYLGWSGLRTSGVTIEQTLAYHGDPPIAATDNPLGYQPLSDLIANPDALFLGRFAQLQLEKKLAVANIPLDGVTDGFALTRLLLKTLSLHANPVVADAEETLLSIRYTGDSQALGRLLVEFFSQRLQERADEGDKRATRNDSGARQGRATQPQSSAPALTPEGPVVIVDHRALWHPDRLMPATALLILSLAVFLTIVALLELLDPSFKSERQMARYLGLPVLGAIPDTQALVKHLRPEKP